MSDPIFRKAIPIDELLLKDERARRLFELQEKARRDTLCMTRTAYARGLEEGRARARAAAKAKGRAEEREVIVRRLLAMGVDPALIAQATDLSPQEIELLRG